jgi:hypothetical protein
MGMPGKLVDSLHIIRYVDENGVAIKGDSAGIALITGERKKERSEVGKMIGIHQERIIFCADDLTELSEAITEAAFYNLSRGCEHFQMVGIGNPKSFYDPFGKFVAPIKGWDSISVEDEEWETARGLCLHFDATKNPRIVDGDERLTWMDTQADIDKEIAIHGGSSASFWRMVRGYWSPTGVVEHIYSEIEIVNAQADQPAIWRDEMLTKVSFLDPSFTSQGDRTVAYFGTFGFNRQGLKTLQYDDYVLFHEDVTDKETTRSQQLIKWWKALCEMRGVTPRHAGFDSTGAGAVFGDVVDVYWSKEVFKLNFSGAATDKPVSAFDSTPCSERYANRCSEIWFSAKEAMRSGQIKGLSADVIQELCTRKKEDEKGLQLRIRVESKLAMFQHTDKSPDIADAAMGLCELCCERLGFSSAVASGANSRSSTPKPFKALFQKKDIFREQRVHLQKLQNTLRL